MPVKAVLSEASGAPSNPTWPAGLDSKLRARLQAARAALPDIHVPDEAFARHLGERMALSLESLETLDRMNLQDLYLACAVMRGDRAAVIEIERHHFTSARVAVTRIAGPESEEVLQVVRHKLFTAEPGMRPKIAEYAGHGSLSGWLRVVAVRTALSMLRARKRQAQKVDVEGHFQAEDAVHSPEIEYFKARYKDEFQSAFRDAMSALSVRQRNLFRFYFVEGLSIDQMGALYGVHRSTVARWLAEARELVYERTQQLLRQRLGISDSEFDSLVVLIKSRLDISIHECLQA